MLIEQLLLNDPSQIVERGHFFKISSEGIIKIVTDEEDSNNEVFSKLSEKLSKQLFDEKILNTSLSKSKYLNITLSDEFKNRKEELVVDYFYYQINFNVDFTLNYFENISKIYLTFCPSLRGGKIEDWENCPHWFDPYELNIGVTGYICYESRERISHQEKLSFKPRTTIRVNDFFFHCVNNTLPIRIIDIFKYDGNYNGMLTLFKEDIAEKLALLI